MNHDIFISYSRYDSSVVNELVALLEQEGYSVWIDRDGIESGEDFKRVISNAIKESRLVLFFSSEHSNVSDWTAKEIGVAVRYKKHIVPIKLDDSNFNAAVEFDLINLDYVDYSKASIRKAMLEKLLRTVRNKLGRGSKEEAELTKARGDKSNPKPKKGLWIGLAAVAVAAVLLVLLLKPKKPVESSDTQAYNACETVDDYRAYLSDYGRNGEHYAEARLFVETYVADSTTKAQELAAQQLAEQQAREKAEAEAKAQAEAEKKEEAAYKKCTTLAGCESYLKTYPKGKYVDEVKAKKAELEAQAKAEAKTKAEAEAKAQAEAEAKTKAEAEAKAQAEAEKKSQLGGSANGHEYVDLGLPSGTLWATCNIGARKPEDYGNYYAWGETSTKSIYNWSTYKYVNGGISKLTKYCTKPEVGYEGFSDNLTELQSGDDPATSWGEGWRTPTKAQWDELLDNTTNQWTTRNGVKGRFFTSKKNGQTLFLPAAGGWDSELSGAGSHCTYRSRSLYTGYPGLAWSFFFNSDIYQVSGGNRFFGYPIRPVRQK